MQTSLPDAHFFRHQYGRLVAVLVRQFGVAALETVEDAAQLALERALGNWSRRGVPERPEAWLTTVARNAVLDELRRRRKFTADPNPGIERARARDSDAVDDPLQDADLLVSTGGNPLMLGYGTQEERDQLRLLFACSSELVPERARLVLCLKLVAGFGTRQIAARLFTSEANVQKLLERGRTRLREAWRGLSSDDALETSGEQAGQRLALVEQVIYLIFNEGYSAERPDAPLRPDLCDDALALAQTLIRATPSPRGSTLALLALMHFLRARLDSRIDERGRLVLLSSQDRSRWDRTQLQLAARCLAQASDRPTSEFSRYHGEALIQAQHCFAPSFEETRWQTIVELYESLERGYPSPLYLLNRAIALAHWQGPAAGIALLEQHTPPSWLAGHYLFIGTRGELERRQGSFDDACRCLRAAIAATPTVAERAVFERRLAWAQAGRSDDLPAEDLAPS